MFVSEAGQVRIRFWLRVNYCVIFDTVFRHIPFYNIFEIFYDFLVVSFKRFLADYLGKIV